MNIKQHTIFQSLCLMYLILKIAGWGWGILAIILYGIVSYIISE